MIANLSERRKQVLKILSEDWNTSVADISNRLNVSAVTIRNDLDGLAENGLIVRTRGGAMPAFHPSIFDRQKYMSREKNRIAKASAELIEDGDHVMIVAGTTTALIPKYLLGKRDVHIVTNSTLLLPYARINPGLRITLVGGLFMPNAEAVVGPVAIRELNQFHVKTAFLGTDGFSMKKGFTAALVEVAEVVKKMASQSTNKVLCADSSKFGKAGFAHILPLTEVTILITDDKIEPAQRKMLQEQGIDIRIA